MIVHIIPIIPWHCIITNTISSKFDLDNLLQLALKQNYQGQNAKLASTFIGNINHNLQECNTTLDPEVIKAIQSDLNAVAALTESDSYVIHLCVNEYIKGTHTNFKSNYEQ